MDEKPKPIAKPKQEGWHSFDAEGLREVVVKAVAASTLPDYIKIYMQSRIHALDGSLNFVCAHYHTTRHGGKDTGHDTVSGRKVLVG